MAAVLGLLRLGLPYLLLAGLAGGGWLWVRHQQSAREAAEARATAAEAAVAGRDAAIAALAERAAAAVAESARSAALRRIAHAAPRTTACVDSPSVAAYLHGLRGEGAAPIVGGAGQAAPMRAGAGSAR